MMQRMIREERNDLARRNGNLCTSSSRLVEPPPALVLSLRLDRRAALAVGPLGAGKLVVFPLPVKWSVVPGKVNLIVLPLSTEWRVVPGEVFFCPLPMKWTAELARPQSGLEWTLLDRLGSCWLWR
jgi:hypothetical protein